MKRNVFPFVLFVLMVSSSAYAAKQIGIVTGSGTFELAGTQVPSSAARSLPLMSAERIETSEFPATTVLQDGSRIVVNKDSAVVLEQIGEDIVLSLEHGSLRFEAVEGSHLIVFALARRIELQAPSEGTVSIETPEEVRVSVEQGPPAVVIDSASSDSETAKTTSSRKKRRAVVIVVAGTAVGTGLGLAVLGTEEASQLPERSPVSP
jgi:hypothetical protein